MFKNEKLGKKITSYVFRIFMSSPSRYIPIQSESYYNNKNYLSTKLSLIEKLYDHMIIGKKNLQQYQYSVRMQAQHFFSFLFLFIVSLGEAN